MVNAGRAGRILLLMATLGAGCASAPPPSQDLGEAYYNLGNAWFEMKKYDQAALAYQKALTWNPSLKIATLNLARTRAELGDPQGALNLLRPLGQSDPDNLVVAQYLAWLTAQHSGLAAAADLYLDLAQRLPGDAATQFNAGQCLKAAGRWSEALTALTAWKSLDGKTSAGLTALAEALEATDSAETADGWLAAAQSFPEGDTRRYSPLASRAKALEKAQMFGDAVEAWDAALALPVAPDQDRGQALFFRGRLLLLHIEDYPKASEALIAAWKAGYKDAPTWKALRSDPALKFSVRLEADLALAGVAP